MEFIGGETRKTYLQTFIAQSNHGSRKTSHTVKSKYACVWDIRYVDRIVMMVRGEGMVTVDT
jgi:hypothetical protein